jgi:DNA-binding MarR family transcriptional regulator
MRSIIPGDAGGPAEPGDSGEPGSGGARHQLGGEVVDLLHAVNHRIRRASLDALEPLGVTPAQGRALRTVHRADGPVRMSDLAARLRVVPRSATTVVDELVERGLVERLGDPGDRRVVAVALTVEGQRLVGELDRGRREAAAALTDRLAADDLATLADLLRVLDQD